MHSIKIIRDNIDLFQKKIKERNVSVNFDKLITLDKKYRETNTARPPVRKDTRFFAATVFDFSSKKK